MNTEDDLAMGLMEELTAEVDRETLVRIEAATLSREDLENQFVANKLALTHARNSNEGLERNKRMVEEALYKNGVSIWDIRLGKEVEFSEEVKEKMHEYLSLGFSVSTLDAAIAENPAANDYWRRMLISLKLGDETGKFKGFL